jgi:hypothetical protein
MINQTGQSLIGGADAHKAFGGHRMQGLIFGDEERIFIAHQSLRVKLERLTHKLGDSAAEVSTWSQHERI